MIELAARVGRWVARILGALMALMFVALFFGEPPRFSQLTTRELLMFLAGGALEVGLILAWAWEGLGGLLILAGFLCLGLLDRKAFGMDPLQLCAAIGCLHLLCWWELRARREPPPSIPHQGILLAIMWTGVGIIVLLLANEAFLAPPLMTPTLTPPPAMVGTWQGDVKGMHIALTIRSDGAASGTIGDAAIADGRIIFNRSWFGQLLHWRTDYLIQGNLPGKAHFSAPLNSRGNELAGTFFLVGGGDRVRVPLRLRR